MAKLPAHVRRGRRTKSPQTTAMAPSANIPIDRPGRGSFIVSMSWGGVAVCVSQPK